MIVQLGICTDEANKLDKSFTADLELNGAFRDEMNVTNPVIQIVGNGKPLDGYNYCFIEKTGRFYFIRDITAEKNGLFVLKCHCDVLNTYKYQIQQLYGTVVESADGSPYINGYSPNYDVRTDYRRLDFDDTKFKPGGAYILIAVQGGDRGGL